MRNPIRSETDAFHITLASTLLICLAVALGAIVEPAVGVAVIVSAVIGALAWELCTKDPDRRRTLREAVAAARREEPGDGPRLLVIANRTLHDDELRATLRRRANAEVHIVVPIVTPHARHRGRRRRRVSSPRAAGRRAARERVSDPSNRSTVTDH